MTDGVPPGLFSSTSYEFDMDGRANVVEEVISGEFPNRSVSSVTRPTRGNHKQTAIVTFADGDSVVVQRSPDIDSIRLETALSGLIRERTTVPVPRVLATGTVDGHGYAIVEHASGSDLHEQFVTLDTSRQRRIARTFGQALGELHDSFSFASYGELSLDLNSVGESRMQGTEATDWREWFTSYAQTGFETLSSEFDHIQPALAAVVEDATLPASPPSTLYPWDFRPGNALVADGEISAILDWGAPLAAAPGLSVAKAEHLVADWYVTETDPLRASFKSGYESVTPYPEISPVYRLAAIAHSAVDSNGDVTRPRYPEIAGADAVEFHIDRFESVL
ncbi:phosphotransferase family protein [Haloferax sp. DFSO60]|uniref:phosphotransferase family protein n=1 Tax=Haloferax sp. DFSO60 TaxID=3388652 RepID=UPI0039785796